MARGFCVVEEAGVFDAVESTAVLRAEVEKGANAVEGKFARVTEAYGGGRSDTAVRWGSVRDIFHRGMSGWDVTI